MNIDLLQVLASGIVTFGTVIITIPILIKVAYLKNLYDKPDGDRKLHSSYIPTLGGISIFLAFFIGFSISGMASQFAGYPYLSAALVLLFFTGLKDDLIGLSPLKKLGLEIIVGGLIILGSGVYIDSFYGVFGVHDLAFPVAFAVTLFTMIVVINAYNLIDGVDGLAGGIGIIATAYFGFGFLMAGQAEMAVMAFILSAALGGFLVFNFKPASIFMGDTGSLIVGFLLSVLAIQFIQLNEIPAFNEVFGYASPILPIAILIVPLYDTIRVFIRRAKRKQSPFSPGKDHVHHELMRMGLGHTGTAITLYVSSFFISLIAFSISSLNVNIILATTIGTALIFFPTNGTKRKLLSMLGISVHFGNNTLKTMEIKNKAQQDTAEHSAVESVN